MGLNLFPQAGWLNWEYQQPICRQLDLAPTSTRRLFALRLEFEAEYKINSHLLHAEAIPTPMPWVQHSFSSDQGAGDSPTCVPAFPIGAFSPLVGARPFRVAPHSGYFGLNYTRSSSIAPSPAALVSRRDDSDFLSLDANFGQTLLLPNRNP